MFLRNDIITLPDREGRYRIIYQNPENNRAQIIALGERLALPEERSLALIDNTATLVRVETPAEWLSPTKSQIERRDDAFKAIKPLLAMTPSIYDPKLRGPLLRAHEKESGVSRQALLKYLREYWQGGQIEDALLGGSDRRGKARAGGTCGRGCPPAAPNARIYQLMAIDLKHIKEVIEGVFLKDSRRSVQAAYTSLIDTHYTYVDGNGDPIVPARGQRPTKRQFEFYLYKHYPLETRLRKREGDTAFERDHRASLGQVEEACQGPGHIYEIDATIADNWVVSAVDRTKIIGKPVVYLIVDRSTRLIVGFYIGLENACWITASQAILSICADKRELCERYGVAYDPEQWPAHEILPIEFVADRAEMLSKPSNYLVTDLRVRVANPGPCRPDRKPVVECRFRLIHVTIADVEPSYSPPKECFKRRGKKYDQDACLTLDEFTHVMLEVILEHNRRPMLKARRTLEEVAAGVPPTSLSLWNHRIRTQTGLLSRVPEQTVRYALLPRGTAQVTKNGIEFEHCLYTSPAAIERGWFVEVRNSRQFSIEVSYDPRIVDQIYIRDPSNPRRYSVATLLASSGRYAGLTFAEVKYFESLKAGERPDLETKLLQSRINFRRNVKPTVDQAKAKLKALKPKARATRKKDIAAERQQELGRERQQTVKVLPRQPHEGGGAHTEPAKVIQMPTGGQPIAVANRSNDAGNAASDTGSPTPAPKTRADVLRAARERIFNG